MTTKGKTIKVFLVDGEPDGFRIAEIFNWTGKIFVFPRTQLDHFGKRGEAQRTGIYFLVGEDPDNPLQERVYTGESDNIFKRLVSHSRDEEKDFWNQSIVIISKDMNLTKAHVRYLESKMIQTISQGGHAKLVNNTQPDKIELPESDLADMNLFLEHIRMMLPVLGFSFAQPKPSIRPIDRESDSPEFFISSVGASAVMREVGGEFVVKKGSTARKQGVPAWKDYKVMRDRLVREKKLVESDDPKLLMFPEDLAFKSVSGAAAVVLGRNANGWLAWKTKSGETYDAYQKQKLEKVKTDKGERETE